MTIGEDKRHKRIHLAVQLLGNRLEFAALVDLARTAQRGRFDFLAVDDDLTVLSALAGTCDRLGLVGTVDTAVDQPFDAARRLATLDHLSDGRSGWKVGGSGNQDPVRDGEFVTVVRAFMDSWEIGAVTADDQTGVYVDPWRIRAIDHRGPHFDVRGAASLPSGPQGRPPIVCRIGDTPEAREFGVVHADVLLAAHSPLPTAQRHYADVRARAVANGRDPNQLKVFNTVCVVVEKRDIEGPTVTVGATQRLVGTADRIAAEMDSYVQSDACDGFVLVPHPRALDEFVDEVVPLLQERGALRTEYDGTTLRAHLVP
jgi:alkanesulfonate monooxygenase SsuD/methylene tetrahydromethanopterin reductase-like flavin-dependent oxidoreductase (luciferase family)